MSFGIVLLLSDRPDRSQALAEAIGAVGECITVGLQTVWERLAAVRAVIADVSLANPESERCLRALQSSYRAEPPPLLVLTRWHSEAERCQAHALGAMICLPSRNDPRTIVALLLQHLSPNTSLADLVVEREVAKAGSVLHQLLQAARTSGRIDPAAVEAGVDPVLQATREGGLARWIELVWKHDDVTFQHCLLVAGLMAAFSASLRLPLADQRRMTRGALVHDVGKAKVPSVILNKPNKLDAYEQEILRAHPILGHDILSASGEHDPVLLAMTRHHHELLDGTGYPDGLRGPAIADPVRLLTICDVYAALIERRPHKPHLSSDDALRAMHGMGGKIEAALVDAFARTVPKHH